VAQFRLVYFEVRQDRNIIVSIRHRVDLGLLEVRGEVDRGVSIDLDHQQLIGEVFAEVGKVSKFGCNLCKVAYGDRTLDTQAIRFKEDFVFLQPCEKSGRFAVKFDVTQGSVAEHVATDAHVLLFLSFGARGRDCEELFKGFLAGRDELRVKDDLLVVTGRAEDERLFVFK